MTARFDFGNMGPEVLNWVVKKPTFDLNAYKYFIQVDADPGSIFIEYQKQNENDCEDVIAEGKKELLLLQLAD